MSWTKVDQSDFYALCSIDPALAEEVKQIANEQGRRFRDVLRSAVHQMGFGRRAGLKEFWDRMTPEERSAHSSKASRARWNRANVEKSGKRGTSASQKRQSASQTKGSDVERARERSKASDSKLGH